MYFSLTKTTVYGSAANEGSTVKVGVYDLVIEHDNQPLAYVAFVDGCVQARQINLDAQVPWENRITALHFIHSCQSQLWKRVAVEATRLGLKMK
uniref:Uncharacterized protein n=1 Tax=viral metagenome TaxID=1070528 RepID=A0A6C0BP85_9ZZZZ